MSLVNLILKNKTKDEHLVIMGRTAYLIRSGDWYVASYKGNNHEGLRYVCIEWCLRRIFEEIIDEVATLKEKTAENIKALNDVKQAMMEADAKFGGLYPRKIYFVIDNFWFKMIYPYSVVARIDGGYPEIQLASIFDFFGNKFDLSHHVMHKRPFRNDCDERWAVDVRHLLYVAKRMDFMDLHFKTAEDATMAKLFL
jgi:hypothetical protein